jgi:hypothetical protein
MFDEKFVRLDTRRLCELTSAADALDMKPLVDLTSRALARLIEGKTPEQVTFSGRSCFCHMVLVVSFGEACKLWCGVPLQSRCLP